MGQVGGGADIRPVEYIADLYLTSGRNIARVTAPGRTLTFYGGHAIVRDLGDILWALLQPDLTIQPTARYWELLPQWIRQLRDPDQGGREAYEVQAKIALPEGWHVGLPPDYALYHDRDTVQPTYGWEPEPPPAPSSPEARCANPGCDTLLTPEQHKRGWTCCSLPCMRAAQQAQDEATEPLPQQACLWCGELFTPVWSQGKASERHLTRYCNARCARRAVGNARRVNAAHTEETKLEQARRLSKAPPTPCAHCGGLFKPYRNSGQYTRYCSRACAGAESVVKMQAARQASKPA